MGAHLLSKHLWLTDPQDILIIYTVATGWLPDPLYSIWMCEKQELCCTMVCFHVISMSSIFCGNYPLVYNFCGDYPFLHFLWSLPLCSLLFVEIKPLCTTYCGNYPFVHHILWRLPLCALLLYSMVDYDITMSNNIAMCIYHDITMHDDVAMSLYYHAHYYAQLWY